MGKDRLPNYLIFCFQNTLSFKGFWKQVSALQYLDGLSALRAGFRVPKDGNSYTLKLFSNDSQTRYKQEAE